MEKPLYQTHPNTYRQLHVNPAKYQKKVQTPERDGGSVHGREIDRGGREVRK